MNFETSLQQIPAPGKGCHPAMMTAANIGILQGYTPDEVQRAIKVAIPEGGRRTVAREPIWQADRQHGPLWLVVRFRRMRVILTGGGDERIN